MIMSSKRLSLDASKVDWIADLPEPIIADILNLLPTKDAGATSLLSKSWRRRWDWTELTTFDVEGPYLDNRRDFFLAVQFMMFIETALANMKAESICKFRLRWTDGHFYFHTWFADAIAAIPRTAKALKVLDLASVTMATLPAEIFTCKTLEVLKLEGEFMVKLPGSVCLPKLADLELNWVEYEAKETVRELVSACPVLRSLAIKRTSADAYVTFLTFISSLSLKRLRICFKPYKYASPENCYITLTIYAPALEYLHLDDSLSKKNSIVLLLTSVNEVELDLSHSHGKESIFGLLKTFDHVKSLKLPRKTMASLVASHSLHRDTINLPASFERLTKLSVEYFADQLKFLVALIDRCVNLEVLEIYCCNTSLMSSAMSWWGYRKFPKCLSSSLRQVTFRPFGVDLPMIEFILKRGLVMERVTLCFDPFMAPYAYERRDEIIQNVLMMQKASPTCKFYRRIGDLGELKLVG